MLVLEFESHEAYMEIHEKRKDQEMARLQKNLEAGLFYLSEANLSELSNYWCIFSDKKRQESAGMSNLNQRPHGCPLVSPIQMVARSTIQTACKISTTLTVPSSWSQSSILNLCSSSNWHLVVKEALKGDVGKGGRVDQRAHAVTYLSSCIIVWVIEVAIVDIEEDFDWDQDNQIADHVRDLVVGDIWNSWYCTNHDIHRVSQKNLLQTGEMNKRLRLPRHQERLILQISAFFLFSNFRKRQIALYSPCWSVGRLVTINFFQYIEA